MVKFIVFRIGGNSGNIWSDSDSGCRSRSVFLLFRSAACCSFASRVSVDLCLEQTRESSQLQLGRVEQSRDSFIRVVSACLQFIQSWSNYLALSKFRQIDFIKRIDIFDISPNNIRSVLFDQSKSASRNRFALGETGRKEGTGNKC
jgi:hypothetical protein